MSDADPAPNADALVAFDQAARAVAKDLMTAVPNAFLLGWNIVELRSRLRIQCSQTFITGQASPAISQTANMAAVLEAFLTKKTNIQTPDRVTSQTPADFADDAEAVQYTSKWRALFTQIVTLHVEAFPDSHSKGSTYFTDEEVKKRLAFLYYKSGTPPNNLIDFQSMGIADDIDSGSLNSFDFYDLTRRAVNCLTLLYTDADKSLIPITLGEFKKRLIVRIIDSLDISKPEPTEADPVEAQLAKTNIDELKDGIPFEKKYQAVYALTVLIDRLLEGWDAYLRENYYTGGKVKKNEIELRAFEAGRSMAALSWNVGVQVAQYNSDKQKLTATPTSPQAGPNATENSSLTQVDGNQAQPDAPLQVEGSPIKIAARDLRDPDQNLPATGAAEQPVVAFSDGNVFVQSTTLNLPDTSPLPNLEQKTATQNDTFEEQFLFKCWQTTFAKPNIVHIQHQIAALSTALDDAHCVLIGKPRPSFNIDNTTQPDPDLPSMAIGAVKHSLDYWQRTLDWLGSADGQEWVQFEEKREAQKPSTQFVETATGPVDNLKQWLLEVGRHETITKVISSTNHSVYGEPITFTALVKGKPRTARVPTGDVTFRAGAVILGTTALGYQGQAVFTTPMLDAGSWPITAEYNGNAIFKHSKSNLPPNTDTKTSHKLQMEHWQQVVKPGRVKLDVTSLINPSKAGQPITFKATVGKLAPSEITPDGVVTFNCFYQGQNPTGQANIITLPVVAVRNGETTCTTTNLAHIGDYKVTAVFESIDSHYNGLSDSSNYEPTNPPVEMEKVQKVDANASETAINAPTPILTTQLSQRLQVQLQQQADVWQSLVSYQQSLAGFTSESITRRIINDVTEDLEEALGTVLINKAQSVIRQNAAIIALILGVLVVVFLIAILLPTWFGNKSDTNISLLVAALLAGGSGYAVKRSTTSNAADVTPAAAGSATAPGGDLLGRFGGAFASAEQALFETFRKGYEQIRVEFNHLNYYVAVAYPLVEFFVLTLAETAVQELTEPNANKAAGKNRQITGGNPNYVIQNAYDFLTQIVWNKEDRDEEIQRVARAALGPIGIFIGAQQKVHQNSPDKNKGTKQ